AGGLVDGLVDPPGRALDANVDGPCDLVADHAPTCRRVQPHRAAEEVRRVVEPEGEVRVGERGGTAAAAVAGRAGIGARAARSDANYSPIVDLRDAAATGADLDHVDDRDAHRKPAAALELVHSRDLELVLLVQSAVADDRTLRRRAAHVEREQVAQPE